MTPRRAAFAWVADRIEGSRYLRTELSDEAWDEVLKVLNAMRAASEVEDVPRECPARPAPRKGKR
jgi:hypothetical protein